MNLNARAARLVDDLLARAIELRVRAHPIEGGGRAVDCGIEVPGGLRAGLELARICMADLAEIGLVPGEVGGAAAPVVQVATDHPVAACLASQYAGWQLARGEVLRDGLRPDARGRGGEDHLRAASATARRPTRVVGVLEGRTTADPRGRGDGRRGLPGRPVATSRS